MAKKPLLDATSKPKSTFGSFTAGYRQSGNIEDKRDGRGEIRARTDMYGMDFGNGSASTNLNDFYRKDAKGNTRTKGTSTPSQRSIEDTSDNTPDDYAPLDIGSKYSATTPSSSSYKASIDEAIRKTHIERK